MDGTCGVEAVENFGKREENLRLVKKSQAYVPVCK